MSFGYLIGSSISIVSIEHPERKKEMSDRRILSGGKAVRGGGQRPETIHALVLPLRANPTTQHSTQPAVSHATPQRWVTRTGSTRRLARPRRTRRKASFFSGPRLEYRGHSIPRCSCGSCHFGAQSSRNVNMAVHIKGSGDIELLRKSIAALRHTIGLRASCEKNFIYLFQIPSR